MLKVFLSLNESTTSMSKSSFKINFSWQMIKYFENNEPQCNKKEKNIYRHIVRTYFPFDKHVIFPLNEIVLVSVYESFPNGLSWDEELTQAKLWKHSEVVAIAQTMVQQ